MPALRRSLGSLVSLVGLSAACSPLSNESTSQKGLAVEASSLGAYYDYAFVPARSLAEWGEQLPIVTLPEREAHWRRELEELGIVNQASAAVFATALDNAGELRFVPERPDLPLRYSCGATFISPSFALTAAHCVASDVSAPTVHLYRPRDGLAEHVAATTVLSGAWPNLSHPLLTADDGYLFDSYDCEVAVRCDDNWGPTIDCPYNIQGRDVAVLRCPEAPGATYGFVDVANEQPALGTELFMAWKHEVYDLAASSVAPQELTQHYVQRLSPETNLHYFGGDQNQLLPLRSRAWSSGEPRTMGSDGWTDLMGCHGTSGSGLLARDESGFGFRLWGIATSALSLAARLCHDPAADGVGDALIASNWYEPGVLLDQLYPTLDEDCRTAFSTDLPRSVDGLGFSADRYQVASWFAQQRCQPLSSTRAATGERFLLEAVADRGVTLAAAESVSVGPFALQAGRDYRLGTHVVQLLPCNEPCSSFTLGPSAGAEALTFTTGADSEWQSAAASFRAEASDAVELQLNNTSGTASFVGLTLLEEGQTNTFDVVFDRLETSLYTTTESDLIGPAPMRFVGDGSVGFSALLRPAERMLLTRQALSPNRLWTVRVEATSYSGLSCGFSDAQGAALLTLPCAALFQLDARALNATPAAFFIELSEAAPSVTVDAVALASDAAADTDGDGIPDVLDSCVNVANPEQGSCGDAGSGAGGETNGGAGGETNSGETNDAGANPEDAGSGGTGPDAATSNSAAGGAAGSAETTENETSEPLFPTDAGSDPSTSRGSGGHPNTASPEPDIPPGAAGASPTSGAPTTTPTSAPSVPLGSADAGFTTESADSDEGHATSDDGCACRTQRSRNHGAAGMLFLLAAMAYLRRRAREAPNPIGHELVGSGPTRVVIMNDWLCDTSTWDGARQFLDTRRFTFAFVDLRGYGRSRGLSGTFTAQEAASDVLFLADALDWARFAIVGHSMSSLVALHLAQQHADRVERAVVLTPPPPTGFGADDAAIAASRALAQADDDTRLAVLEQRFGARLSPAWASYKAERWRATADAAAAAGYVTLFARDGLPHPTVRVSVPVLAITGERDAPPMRGDAVTRALEPLCERLVVTPLADAGHYPMQEMPPLTVALVERFLSE